MKRSRPLMVVIGALLVLATRPGAPAEAAPIRPEVAATTTTTTAPLPSGAIALGDQTSPSDGQTVATSPDQLSLVFTAPLTQAPGVVVQNGANAPIAPGPVQRGDDAQTWYVALTSPLSPDTYRVTWTAGGSTGAYTFTVGTGATASGATASDTSVTGVADSSAGVAATAAGDTTSTTATESTATAAATPETAKALNVIARWISYLALGSLLGGLVLIAYAWGEGVEYVLTVRFLRLAWGVALAATVLNIACSRAVQENASLGSSLSPGAWGDLTDNASGMALLARFVLLLACGWVISGPERAVDEATQIPALLPAVLAVATFGFTRAASGLDLFVTPAGVIHVIGFSVWFGGLVLLWRVVLAGSGGEDLVDAVRGFSRLATPALLAVLLSGVVLTAKLLGGASELFGSSYGRLLLLKAIVVAGAVYAGMINRQTVQQRLARQNHLPGRTAVRLRRAIGTEMLAGIVVLGLTGWMVGSTPQGLPDAVARDHIRPAFTTPIGNDNVKLDIGVGPATVGLNDVTIDVLEPAQGLVALTLRFDPVDAYVESIVISVTPTLTGRGQMIVDDVPFNAPGKWVITASGDDTKGKLGESQATMVIGTGAGPAATTPTETTAPATATTPTAG